MIRTYCYGAKPPTQNAELVDELLGLAHRYRNKLVEIEKARHARYLEITGRHPPVAELAAAEEELQRTLTGDPGAAAEAKRALKKTRELTKTARRKTMLLDEYRIPVEESDKKAAGLAREARHASGLKNCWGTYQVIEDAIRRGRETPTGPQFKRWDWSGQIAVHVQNRKMRAEELLEGKDNWLRVVGEGKRRQLWMRVGSEGRAPVWAVFPFSYHRGIPTGAEIKWARAYRRKVGTRLKWEIQFVLKVADRDVALPPPMKGTVGIDVGWRKIEKDVRVAVWADDEGRAGELCVPQRLLDRWRKTEELRSIRDKNFNAALAALVYDRRERGETWPKWLREETTHAHAWKSQEKLAALVIKWRGCAGNDPLYEILETWRKQDKHLHEWEDNQRENVLRSRRENYRLFSLEMARYWRVAIEDLDLRNFAQLPDEDDRPETAASRPRRFKVALYELLSCLVDAVTRAGGEVHEVPPEYTTQWCHDCDTEELFDAAATVEHTCSHCGQVWDQDANAARNLLRAADRCDISKRRSQPQKLNEKGETKSQERRRKGLETRRARRSKTVDQPAENVGG